MKNKIWFSQDGETEEEEEGLLVSEESNDTPTSENSDTPAITGTLDSAVRADTSQELNLDVPQGYAEIDDGSQGTKATQNRAVTREDGYFELGCHNRETFCTTNAEGEFEVAPDINNPNHPDFDPEDPGSRTSTGEIRRSESDWDQYNTDRDQRTLNYRNTGSSGDMLARGVSFGRGSLAGLGGGWGGQNITLNPFKASNSPLSRLKAGGGGYQKKFPWSLVIPALFIGGYFAFRKTKFVQKIIKSQVK